MVDASYRDGVIACSFERDVVSAVRDTIFDLNNDKFHLFLAAGSSLKPTGVGYHDLVKRSTDEPRYVSEIEQVRNLLNHRFLVVLPKINLLNFFWLNNV
jgi:hypothetical protein